MSTTSPPLPSSTTPTNVAFIARPSFETSLEDDNFGNEDDDIYFDDEDFDGSDSFLPKFKSVHLGNSRSRLAWPTSNKRSTDPVSFPIPDSDPPTPKLFALRSEADSESPEPPFADLSLVRNSVVTRSGKFYDSRTAAWVDVENFAFAAEQNHFSDQSDQPHGDQVPQNQAMQPQPKVSGLSIVRYLEKTVRETYHEAVFLSS